MYAALEGMYTIRTRTDDVFAGKRAAATTPPTAYSVTLDAVTTAGQGAVQYGYTTGGETAVPEERLQTETTFDGLAPGTTYTFHARYAGTSLYEPSPASAGTPVTTERADSALTVVPAEGILTYGETLKITVTPEQTAAYGINALTTAQDVVELKTGDAVLASATTANAGGSYTLTYDTRGKGLAIGNNALTVSYGGSGSLNPSTGGVKVTLEKANVDAALDGTTSKTYDETTAAPDGLVIALTGVLEGDEVAASSASIAYDSADAGNNRTITATGITLTGEDAAYCSLVSETASVQSASISKVTPALALTADPAALSGGGRVTLTLAGVPDGGSATVTCEGDVDVTEGDDGTWVAELPNQTADYTFTASYAGDGNHSAAQAACVVTTRYAPPYVPPAKTPSQQAIDKIRGAKDGDTVRISLSSGDTKLDKEVFQALAGRDVTLVLEMGEAVSWEIWGGDVPEGASLSDVDMGVELGTDGIPVEVVDLVTGEAGVVQVTLAHDGEFGFELTLVAPLGEKDDGLFANLHRYDEGAGTLRYECSGVVDDGVARLRLGHASRWAVALDSRSHALPFGDAAEGRWHSEAVRRAWLHGVMTGYADGSGLFGAGDELTRAQMAAALHNAAGGPEAEVSGLPPDCDPSAWHAGAVAWALQEGLFHGYGDGSAFGPDDPLTREQAACVLHNAAGRPASAAGLSSFSDAPEVSDWAEAAVSWAVSEGVLHGHDGLLEPARALTRAEAAALMANLASRG